MVQRGEDFGFALEAREAVGVSRERLGQGLERHVAVELGVAGTVDLAHPPGADEGGHVVVRQACADGQGHRMWCGITLIMPPVGTISASSGWLGVVNK